MQLFVNCLGESQCISFKEGQKVEELLDEIKSTYEINSDIQLFGLNRKIEFNEELDQSFNGISLSAQVCVLGGKGKKKKKNYTTPKRIKHKHVTTKLHTLSYYAVGKDGAVQRVKKFCEQESCKEKGIFMAAHWNRYYCGKCGLTLLKTDAPAEEPKKKVKK